MLRTRNITLSGTAQELTINDGINTANTISVQNTDTSALLYIGNESVTATEYGIKLAAGQIWSADLKPDDQVYAVGTSTVAVMILEK